MTAPLTQNQRYGILLAAFMGWFFGGMQIAITNVAMRDAAIELMADGGSLDLATYARLQTLGGASLSSAEAQQLTSWNAAAVRWYAWFQCAFLFGAAAGGFLFGRLGDRIGRTKSLAFSILCFAILTGVSYFARSPAELLAVRFLACIGIGGTWPNGVALVSEAWSAAARPLVSSAIGMAGNLGIFIMFSMTAWRAVTPEDWRWVMLVGAVPVVLGIWTWFFVAESPTWLSQSHNAGGPEHAGVDDTDHSRAVRPDARLRKPETPDRKTLIIGIALATVPLIGGWGSANWMLPWAGEVGAAVGNDFLKANVGQARSITSIIGSLFAGWIACRVGRRLTYGLTCVGACVVAQYAFRFTTPTDGSFLVWVAILGLFNGIFFGWLPFFLPELFRARVRAAGTGISLDSGRILTAFTIFATGAMEAWFKGDYAAIGRVTSWVFLLGVIVIAYAPDTSRRNMDE